MKLPLAAMAAVIVGCLGQNAIANEISVNISILGWYTDTGHHDSSNVNTLTGYLTGTEYRSFYLWDLPAFTGTVTSARIEFALPYSLGVSSLSQMGKMFDVTNTSVATIANDDGAGQGLQIFSDLGSGLSYGDFVISDADSLTTFIVNLNQNALDAINASAGQAFAIGMQNVSPCNQCNDYFLFSSMSNQSSQILVLDSNVVPEPVTLALMVSGLGLVGLSRRKQFAKAKHSHTRISD